MKTNIKLRVTPEQSEAVQKICFANGLGWGENLQISYLDASFLFIKDPTNQDLIYSFNEEYFNKEEDEEVDTDLFIRTNGTCEESVDIVDNVSNNKSKEDMFKQYGFEVPDFECTILTKVKDEYVGYVINNDTVIAVSWTLRGTCYNGVTYASKHNLTPIKQPWYETCKYPVLVWDTFADKLEVATEYTNNTLYLLSDIRDASEVRPLSNEEIDQLKQDF